jgi:hypothetical protein
MSKPAFPPRKRTSVTPDVEVVLDAYAEHVSTLLDAITDFAETTHWTPLDDDAPLEVERGKALQNYGPGGDWSDEEITYAHAAGVLHTVVAAQLLEGMEKLLVSREVLFSLAPLVRSTVEHCGYVHWILDPGNSYTSWTIRDRVARVLLGRIADRARAAATATQLKAPHLEPIVNSKKKLRKERLPYLFYPSEIEVDSSGEFTLRKHQTVPGPSSLITYIENGHNTSWNAKGMYAMLSNATHPTFSHLAEFVDVAEDGKTSFKLDDTIYIGRLARAGILSVSLSWQLVLAYLGRPQTVAQQLMDDLQSDPRLVEEP